MSQATKSFLIGTASVALGFVLANLANKGLDKWVFKK